MTKRTRDFLFAAALTIWSISIAMADPTQVITHHDSQGHFLGRTEVVGGHSRDYDREGHFLGRVEVHGDTVVTTDSEGHQIGRDTIRR